ncbi:MAG TPA: endonuclease VII domain-containing protein [Acidimicrobiales bacterium]|nr:endonuclease VII domain-containing protein [Acidimicrobiales bacterium]
MKKRCVKCGKVKPLSDFYTMAGMRDGHRNDCKSCNLAAKAARYRANPEPAKERARQWARENPDRVKAQRARVRESGRRAEQNRRSHLKRKYGISLAEYDRLLDRQDGRCGICGRPPRDDISLHVDHDHGSGEIRGLLCFRCNNALGDFGDDPQLLDRAVAYLAGHRENLAEVERMTALARARAQLLVVPNGADAAPTLF